VKTTPAAVGMLLGFATTLGAHPHHGPSTGAPAAAVRRQAPFGVSGEGAFRFRVRYTSEHLPQEARAVLEAAHGGFAVDRRPGRGEIYFALPGAGIVQVAGDLGSTRMLPTPPQMRETNLHNTTIWYDAGGTAYLTFPANDAGVVYTTTLDGELVNALDAPTGDEDLGESRVADYFRVKGPFTPTDVDYLEGWLYVATGYSPLDTVLTARVAARDPLQLTWNDLSFGGRGSGAGQFGTGHGVTVWDGQIEIADRPNAEVDRFTRYGHYTGTLELPAGSFPCDVDHLGSLAVVGALHGPDRNQGAPVYVLEGDRVVSTIRPKQDLGLDSFQHVHNAVFHRVNDVLYIVVQAWNPGDFAILEQVREPRDD